LPEGTEVEALLLGACPNRLGALDISNLEVLRIVADDIGTSHLYAVAEARDASFPEVRYIAVFGDGGRWTSFALTNTGVAGVAWSCDTPDFVAWARTVDSWLLPPLYPLPD
jgi:hypothetical protein